MGLAGLPGVTCCGMGLAGLLRAGDTGTGGGLISGDPSGCREGEGVAKGRTPGGGLGQFHRGPVRCGVNDRPGVFSRDKLGLLGPIRPPCKCAGKGELEATD